METTLDIFRLPSRRWPSHQALDFLARVQFQLSAEQRENMIRWLDIYPVTTVRKVEMVVMNLLVGNCEILMMRAVNLYIDDDDLNFFSVSYCAYRRESF